MLILFIHCHVYCLLLALGLRSVSATPPHIIFIVSDDLGWNDIGYNNPDLLTPNLNRLASQGVILDSSYVQPVCTPTRASILTGYFPMRLGLQRKSIRPAAPKFIPSNFTLLPQLLKKHGYQTHMVGKWHLGFCNWKYTPTRRGFDSFFGYLYGSNDYYTHTAAGAFDQEIQASTWITSGLHTLVTSSVQLSRGVNRIGYGFWYNESVHTDVRGRYSSEVLTERAVQIINQHDKSKPLFLFLAFKIPHSPLQVPERYEKLYSHVRQRSRRLYCGMVSAMDEAIGTVTSALDRARMMDNLLIIFTSDNGGAVYEGGNNWPLRGAKTTLWEGGTRSPAFVYSRTLLKKRGYKHRGLFHAVDWFPTLAHIAGSLPVLSTDGVNQWDMLSIGGKSKRHEFLYNVDEIEKDNSAALRVGDWKLIRGRPGIYNRWYPLSNLQGPQSSANLRDRTSVNSTYMLFNIKADPEEREDLLDKEPAIVDSMIRRLGEYSQQMVPAQDPTDDPRADPELFNGVWSPGWC